MTSKLKVGVIGVGKLGAVHCRIYSELKHVNFIGIYDTNFDKAIEVGKQFSVKVFPTLDSLLSEVDAVSIVVPTINHYKVACEVIEKGVHCLIEKPFTGSIVLAKRLLSKAKKRGLILQVGHVERFNSAMQLLREMVPSAPLFVECHRLSPFPNRGVDVSVVMDLMIHDIDICLWFIPYRLKSVEAVGAEVLTSKEDIANARLRFSNGSICDITASRISDETMRKIRMFFPGAYVSIDYLNQEIELFLITDNGIEKRKLLPDKVEPLKAEISAFIESVIHKRDPVVSGVDGLVALKVAEKVLRSIQKNKTYIYRRALANKVVSRIKARR